MMKKHRIKIAVCVANLVIIAICIHIWVHQPPPGFPIVFSAADGTKFSIQNMESKTQVYPDEISVYQELLTCLPDSWHLDTGMPPPIPVEFNSPALVFSYNKLSLPSVSVLYHEFRLFDDCGDELHEFPVDLIYKKRQSAEVPSLLIFEDYAPSSKWFRLQIRNRNDPNHRVIKEIVITNRFYHTASSVAAKPLPQRATNNEIVVNFTKAVWTQSDDSYTASYYQTSRGRTELTLNLECNGQPATNWFIQGVECTMVNGSSSWAFPVTGWSSNLLFSSHNARRPREPARFTVYVQQGQWSSNEIWNSPPIPVATNGSYIPLPVTNFFLGRKIVIHGSVASGVRPPWREVAPDHDAIDVDVLDLPEDPGLVVVGLKDGKGKGIPGKIHGYGANAAGDNAKHYTYELERSNKVNFVNLQLAVRRHKEVEFLVQPEIQLRKK